MKTPKILESSGCFYSDSDTSDGSDDKQQTSMISTAIIHTDEPADGDDQMIFYMPQDAIQDCVDRGLLEGDVIFGARTKQMLRKRAMVAGQRTCERLKGQFGRLFGKGSKTMILGRQKMCSGKRTTTRKAKRILSR